MEQTQTRIECPACHSTDVTCRIRRLTVNRERKALYECQHCGKRFYGPRQEDDNDDNKSNATTD